MNHTVCAIVCYLRTLITHKLLTMSSQYGAMQRMIAESQRAPQRGSKGNPIDLSNEDSDEIEEEDYSDDPVMEVDEESDWAMNPEFREAYGKTYSKKSQETQESDISEDSLSDAPPLEDFISSLTSNLTEVSEELLSSKSLASRDLISASLALEEQLKSASRIVKKKIAEWKDTLVMESLSRKDNAQILTSLDKPSKPVAPSQKLRSSTRQSTSSSTKGSKPGLKLQKSKTTRTTKGLSTLNGVQLESARRPGLTRTVSMREDTIEPLLSKRMERPGSPDIEVKKLSASKIMDMMEANYGSRPFSKSSITGNAQLNTKEDTSTSSQTGSSSRPTSLPQNGTQEQIRILSQPSEDVLPAVNTQEPQPMSDISVVKNGISQKVSVKPGKST